MATFFWIPNRDKAYQGEFCRLAKAGGKLEGNFNHKFLRPEDCMNNEYAYAGDPRGGTNTSGMFAAWDNIQDGDSLYIGAHGGQTDSSQVAWKNDRGVLTWWTARQLAESLSVNLLGGNAPSLDYHLYACFGANNCFKTGECFGTRLRREMMVAGLRGKLTAYNGAVGLNANGGQQTGSSRVTCAFWYVIKKPDHNSGSTAAMGKSWDLHPYSRSRR